MPGPTDPVTELRHHRVAPESAPRVREVARRGAVEAAQLAHTIRAELLGPPACGSDQDVELLPLWRSLAEESV
jgi:hypothetical protein